MKGSSRLVGWRFWGQNANVIGWLEQWLANGDAHVTWHGQSDGRGGWHTGSGTMEACVWVFQMFATHTSFMFSCLNNKQTKIQFSIFTSGTIPLPFYLSKYIIYIILEYIKYRMGTIPFHTSRVLCKYSNNCSKTQFVFQWFLYF